MIRVQALSKRYMIYHRPLERMADWVLPARLHLGRPFWALRDLTFDVPAGSSLGIVGVNGAGKSTLLKILTGTTAATEGHFDIRGRVSSLLELGTGFHPEFTGLQNIRFNGKLAGLDDEELAAKLEGIVQFAELGQFIDQPVRTYSSGMILRLGFALASSVDPDVLIVDEALSVGDLHFQQKCLRRIRQFHERGTTVLFVSHDPSMVKNFCTEAILLDGGRLIDRGRPDQVLDYYTALLAEKYREGGGRAAIHRPGAQETGGGQAAGESTAWTAPPLRPAGHRTGNFQAVLTSVYFDAPGAHGNPNIMASGAETTLRVRAVALEPIDTATLGIAIKDRLGQDIFGVNTAYRMEQIGPLAAGEAVEAVFALSMNLGDGLYSVTAAIHAGEDHTGLCYDWVEQALTFQVLPTPADRFTGLCRLPARLELTQAAAPEAERDFARQTREALNRHAGS